MRTRIRSDAQHHAGRRRHVARRPPDDEVVLRLQRTIGNRATTRLAVIKHLKTDLLGLTKAVRAGTVCPRLPRLP